MDIEEKNGLVNYHNDYNQVFSGSCRRRYSLYTLHVLLNNVIIYSNHIILYVIVVAMNTLESRNQECFNRFCSCYVNLPCNEDDHTFFFTKHGAL